MESRKWKYKKNQRRFYQKLIFLLTIGAAYFCFTFFINSLPASYAWFYSSSSSKGEIINSTTIDLIKIIPEKIVYDRYGRVKSRISVRNISRTSIPLKVELLCNNAILYSSSTNLKPNDTFSTKLEEIKNVPTNLKFLQFRIVGFNGYIDEVISVPVDQKKVNPPIHSNAPANQAKSEEVKPAETVNSNGNNQVLNQNPANDQNTKTETKSNSNSTNP